MSATAAPKPPSDLVKRTLAGVAMIAVTLVAVGLGGFPFWLLAAVAAMLMMAEWADLTGADWREKRLALFATFVPVAIMAPVAAGPWFLALGLIAAAFFFIVIVTRKPWLAAGAFYMGVPILALLLVREQRGWVDGLVCAIWLLATVWLTDIGAYFAGRAIGGPKLAPAISPAKTWSGLIGGMAAASLWGVFMHWQYGLALRLTLATPALAVAAQAGDLFESWLKRRAGVKDSGNLLPGHGGVLDRLDGLVPVAPLAAVLVLYPVALQRLFG